MRRSPVVAFLRFLSVFAVLALAGCSPQPPPQDPAGGRQDEAAYFPPVSVDRFQSAGPDTEITGLAAAGARVQLTRPGGERLTVEADAEGRWRLKVTGGAPMVFGLSQVVQGRTLQAEGYVFHSPATGGWLLRAGASARPLGDAGRRALVIDYDRRGGTIISGQAPPEGLFVAQINGRRAGEGRSDVSGRYEIRLNGPVPMGESRLRVFGEGLNREMVLRLSSPAPLVEGPVRVTPLVGGTRIDWMTPGGGVQSTEVLP